MASETAVLNTNLTEYLPLLARGKVREVYEVDDKSLLFVATDRISAYDYIMKNGIPTKGSLLTLLSARWFSFLQSSIPNLRTHFISLSLPSTIHARLPTDLLPQVENRSMLVRRLKVFPIEAIVRGYITGSGWAEYREKGTVHGMQVYGEGGGKLVESERFQTPIYTPSTKAEVGGKDENIHPDEAAKIIGPKYAKQIEALSLEIYTKARDYALSRGIIIADTKFEFGLDEETDEVVLVDEVLTPDSSRFWPADRYEKGRSQESFDKQFLRDWLTKEGLKGKEGVEIPENVIAQTKEKYQKAYDLLFGDQ
ncbi:phosphoribosylaminoimidazole-succinocarboxamide synthase [Xylogone sp. PMI_703]|nr:phosphoribosylaminoimidazole-succinocarboxamide synthase [Xylogone sp. PMI_703]